LSYLSLPACNWVFLANTVVTDEIYLFTGEFPAAVDPALCDPCVARSRVGTHRSGA
jgi:hypothetical protein